MNQIRSCIVLILFNFFLINVSAQETHVYEIRPEGLTEARRLFSDGQYALAYPLFHQMALNDRKSSGSSPDDVSEEIEFSGDVCALKLMIPGSRGEAVSFTENTHSPSSARELKFHIGHYDYLNTDFESAIGMLESYLEGSVLVNDAQENQALFELGYCRFQQKDYAKALENFETLLNRKENAFRQETLFYAANASYQLKKYDRSLELFGSISNLPRYNEEVPYYIANIYYAQGNKSVALQYADSVLNTSGAEKYRAELGLLSAKLNFEKKDYTKALVGYEAYVSGKSKIAKDVLYELSYCYYQTNNHLKAIEGFRQLSNEKDSVGQNSMYLLGDLYIRQGDKSNARTAFQYCAGNNSNPVQQRISRLNYAKLSYELGFQDLALNEVRAYLKDYSTTKDLSETDPFAHLSEAKELLVALLANTSNYDEGLEIYKTIPNATASTRKIHARLLYGKGIKLLNEQRPSEALEMFNKIVLENANPEVIPYAKFWKGELAYRTGNYDECIWNMNEFLAAKPAPLGDADQQNANYQLGYASMKKGLYKNAYDYFSAAISDKSKWSVPFRQDLQVRQADCLFMLKEFDKSDAAYKQLIEAQYVQSDYALYQRAVIAGIRNKSEKIRLLTLLSGQYPASPYRNDVQMEIALTHINEEHYSAAIPYLQALSTATDASAYKPIALLKLGLCYYNTSDNNNAIKSYRSLVQQFPNSEEAEEALPVIKDIFVDEGKANEYLEFMKSNGIAVNVSEADSLSFVVAQKKYQSGDQAAAISALGNYISQYPNGAYALDAHYYRGFAYRKTNDVDGALADFSYVNSKGSSKFYDEATLEIARINYLEKKDYVSAKKYFETLYLNARSQEKQLDGMRGLVRCYYQLNDFAAANKAASDLLKRSEVSTDDKAIANLVLGKSFLVNKDTASAIEPLKSVLPINKASWGAEARYELASAYFALGNMKLAEKTAMSTIKETGSYDLWVTRSYILLGDIFLRQKDYFNAKATFQSVAENATIPDLKTEAADKYQKALDAEKKSSKIK